MNVLVERKDGVGRVTLNRPEVRNAFDDALISALAKTFAELDAFIAQLLEQLLAGAAAAHARIKDLVRDIAGQPIDDAVKADTARRIAEIRASPEGKEGIASFLEKRKPKWLSGKS